MPRYKRSSVRLGIQPSVGPSKRLRRRMRLGSPPQTHSTILPKCTNSVAPLGDYEPWTARARLSFFAVLSICNPFNDFPLEKATVVCAPQPVLSRIHCPLQRCNRTELLRRHNFCLIKTNIGGSASEAMTSLPPGRLVGTTKCSTYATEDEVVPTHFYTTSSISQAVASSTSR